MFTFGGIIAPLALLTAALLPQPLLGQPSPASPAPPIQDNSFLIEEAYNQEAGVVQHIGVFSRLTEGPHWSFAFTQEWPLFGQRHQLSYTLPLETATAGSENDAGIGDAQLHYRYQVASGVASAIAVAPRLTVLFPTGDERRGRGVGAPGVQVNVPVSAQLTQALVLHWNAGATHTPSARNDAGHRATTSSLNLGQSLVWLARPTLNVLLELVWERGAVVTGPDQRSWDSQALLAPGIRGAFNFPSGLQIVPGLALPIDLGSANADPTLLLYLSVEHGFGR